MLPEYFLKVEAIFVHVLYVHTYNVMWNQLHVQLSDHFLPLLPPPLSFPLFFSSLSFSSFLSLPPPPLIGSISDC